jgi:hypothetical protein
MPEEMREIAGAYPQVGGIAGNTTFNGAMSAALAGTYQTQFGMMRYAQPTTNPFRLERGVVGNQPVSAMGMMGDSRFF